MIAAILALLAELAKDSPEIIDAVEHFVAAAKGNPAPTTPLAPEVQAQMAPALAKLKALAGK